MADQQPDPGDLTEVTEPEASEGTEPDADESTEPEADESTEPEPEPAPIAPRRRRGPKRLALLAAALFVGSAAFAGAMLQPYVIDRAQVAIKLDVAQTAAAAINTLWNYTPENMDTLVDRAAVYLSGDLEAQYRKFIDAIAEGNKQAKVTDVTEIVGVAVESMDGPQANVIVYTNTSATSELTKSVPSIKYLAYRLHMQRDQNRWLVNRMQTVTSLDLTPRF